MLSTERRRSTISSILETLLAYKRVTKVNGSVTKVNGITPVFIDKVGVTKVNGITLFVLNVIHNIDLSTAGEFFLNSWG